MKYKFEVSQDNVKENEIKQCLGSSQKCKPSFLVPECSLSAMTEDVHSYLIHVSFRF